MAVFAAFAVVGCHDEPALVDSFMQTVEAGSPVVPQTGSQYPVGGLEYKGICIYEDDSYAHVTHYWAYHSTPADEVERGTFTRKGTDSLFFAGKYFNMRGRLDDSGLNIENGTHVFGRGTPITCPASR
jgi:hypothetical protein